MLKICLVFWKSEPQYAYKLYAYKKKHVVYVYPLKIKFLFDTKSIFDCLTFSKNFYYINSNI